LQYSTSNIKFLGGQILDKKPLLYHEFKEEQYDNWVISIKNNPVVVGYDLGDICDLIVGTKAQLLRLAMFDYIETKASTEKSRFDIENIPLSTDSIVAKMKDKIIGIKLQDITVNGKMITNAFTGEAAVTWLVDIMNFCSRQEATLFGRLIVTKRLIENAIDGNSFCDDKSVYYIKLMDNLPKPRSRMFEYEPVPSLSTNFDSDSKSYTSIEDFSEIHRSITITNTGEDSFKIIHDIKELTVVKDENQLSPNRRRRKVSASKDKKIEEGNKLLAVLDRIKFEVDGGDERRIISIEELVRSMFNARNGLTFKTKKISS